MAAICSGQWPPGGFEPKYSNLRPSMSVLEPAAAVLRYAGSADNTLRGLSRSMSHTDITVELCAEQTGLNGSHVATAGLTIAYRSDGSGNNEYRAFLNVLGEAGV